MPSRRSPSKKTPVRNAEASREKVWTAAAQEFAAKGFDGAKVDRIAAAADVNKAMIYYHFASKAGLYNAILHDTFSAIAAAVRDVREAGGTAEFQMRAYVAAIAGIAEGRPFFPPIWLREVAEAGRHLDPTVAGHFEHVLSVLGGILQQGVREGTMRPAHPFLVQLGIAGPLALFLASQPLRAKFAQAHKGMDVSVQDMVQHLQAITLGGLAPAPPRTKTMRKSR
jgi:TetR/AcrR family transcriptional regulator